MKIAFIHAPEVYYEQNFGARFAPVWAYTLASYITDLPHRWTATVVDLTEVSVNSVEDADVFAFSGINQDISSIKKAYASIKKMYPERLMILGGPITWSYEQNGNLSDLLFFDHLFILDGEETFPAFLQAFVSGKPSPQVIRAPRRFDLKETRTLRFDLLETVADRYYGGVVEVSRGCPFLCEFCDIRILPDNNRSHCKTPEQVVREIDGYWRLGVRQIQLACDNFIGDHRWAKLCVDAIKEWSDQTGAQMAFHTWVTINLASLPELMKSMRQAGFTSLFIGVESFNSNSILETSKVQNRNEKNQMVDSIKEIHSYGFIVAPGLIFGFDSDPPEMFESMLEGISQAGLIGGDPTFLLALPGTPLFKRMSLSGRLIGNDCYVSKSHVTGLKTKTLTIDKARVSKIQSNIRYLQPSRFLLEGYLRFHRIFTSGKFNYQRFKNHVAAIQSSQNVLYRHQQGYGNLPRFLKFQLRDFEHLRLFLKRLFYLLRPDRVWTLTRAALLVLKVGREGYPGIKNHFLFWAFTWSNATLKGADLCEADFNLQSVEDHFDLNHVWDYLDTKPEALTNGKNTQGIKVAQQMKSTHAALRHLKKDMESRPDNWRSEFEAKLKKYRSAA